MEKLNVITEIVDVEEARRRLPALREAVAALMEVTRKIKTLHQVMRERAAAGDAPGAAADRDELERLDHAWREDLSRVNALGAYVKDPEAGLVDFYTWRDGEMVFLCWCHGEPDIAFWHGIHAGFAGRKPID